MLPVYYWILWKDNQMNKLKHIGKKWLATAMVFVLMISLTGCMGEQVGIVYNSDGTCGYTMKYFWEEAAYNYMLVEDDADEERMFFQSGDYQTGKEIVNGKTYYTYSRSFSFGSYEEMKKFLTDDEIYLATLKKNSVDPDAYNDQDMDAPFSALTMDGNGFTAELNINGELGAFIGSSSESSSKIQETGYTSSAEYYSSLGMLLDITVTLPTPIIESNGVVSDTTVTWKLNNMPIDRKLIAVTYGNPITSDTQAPTISGVDEGKKYGTVDIYAEDNVGLKSLVLDGINYSSNLIHLDEHGNHTIIATDGNNNTTVVNFSIDAKTPKVKGVKSGKTYKKSVKLRFSDDTGVKYVKINGKKIKSKKKVKIRKPGIYYVHVCDKYGNVNDVYFKIKKKK